MSHRSIPTIDMTIPENIRSVLLAIKESIEIRENNLPKGNIRNKNVTYQDLIDLGLITKDELP